MFYVTSLFLRMSFTRFIVLLSTITPLLSSSLDTILLYHRHPSHRSLLSAINLSFVRDVYKNNLQVNVKRHRKYSFGGHINYTMYKYARRVSRGGAQGGKLKSKKKKKKKKKRSSEQILSYFTYILLLF